MASEVPRVFNKVWKPSISRVWLPLDVSISKLVQTTVIRPPKYPTGPINPDPGRIHTVHSLKWPPEGAGFQLWKLQLLCSELSMAPAYPVSKLSPHVGPQGPARICPYYRSVLISTPSPLLGYSFHPRWLPSCSSNTPDSSAPEPRHTLFPLPLTLFHQTPPGLPPWQKPPQTKIVTTPSLRQRSKSHPPRLFLFI